MLSLEGNQISVMLSCMSLEVNNVFLEVLSACLSSYSPQRQPATPSTSSPSRLNTHLLREYQIDCITEKCLVSVGVRLPAVQEV